MTEVGTASFAELMALSPVFERHCAKIREQYCQCKQASPNPANCSDIGKKLIAEHQAQMDRIAGSKCSQLFQDLSTCLKDSRFKLRPCMEMQKEFGNCIQDL